MALGSRRFSVVVVLAALVLSVLVSASGCIFVASKEVAVPAPPVAPMTDRAAMLDKELRSLREMQNQSLITSEQYEQLRQAAIDRYAAAAAPAELAPTTNPAGK